MKLTFRNLKALARVKVAILLFAALFTFFVVNLNLRTKVRRDSPDTNRYNEPLIQWHPDGIATLIKATKEIEQLKIKSTNSEEPKTSPEIQKPSPKRLEPTPAKLTIKIAKPCKLNIDNELSKESPRIQLDGNKFMLPFLIWGPNNQLIGLRDSIFLAIKLNRTLVLPHFFTQYNDKGAARNTLVQARNRIDVTNLSKFISVISLKDFQTICLGKMDVVFQNRPVVCGTIREAEKMSGIDISGSSGLPGVGGKLSIKKDDPKCRPDISAYPPSVTDNTKHDVNRLREIFNSTAKCAMFMSPFQSLSVSSTYGRMNPDHYDRDKVAQLTRTENVAKVDPYRLMSAIEHETPRPPYVVKIASDFVREVMKAEEFISVHWRNDEEFTRTLCKINPKDLICSQHISPTNLAAGISKVRGQIRASKGNGSHSEPQVYIAGPPTLRAFVDDTKKILEHSKDEKASKTITFTTSDLNNYLDANYPRESCIDMRPTDNEFLSLIEMEICSQSVAFLGSKFSSWSAVVQHHRPTQYFKFDDVAQNVALTP